MENSICQNTKHRITMWSSNSTSGYTQKMKAGTHICTSMVIAALLIVAKRWKQQPISRWLDKQNVVHIYSGKKFLKKEWNSDPCYYVDEAWRHNVKWNS